MSRFAKVVIIAAVGGLLAGGLMAVVGILPPLWRCLKLPIVEALRTT